MNTLQPTSVHTLPKSQSLSEKVQKPKLVRKPSSCIPSHIVPPRPRHVPPRIIGKTTLQPKKPVQIFGKRNVDKVKTSVRPVIKPMVKSAKTSSLIPKPAPIQAIKEPPITKVLISQAIEPPTTPVIQKSTISGSWTPGGQVFFGPVSDQELEVLRSLEERCCTLLQRWWRAHFVKTLIQNRSVHDFTLRTWFNRWHNRHSNRLMATIKLQIWLRSSFAQRSLRNSVNTKKLEAVIKLQRWWKSCVSERTCPITDELTLYNTLILPNIHQLAPKELLKITQINTEKNAQHIRPKLVQLVMKSGPPPVSPNAKNLAHFATISRTENLNTMQLHVNVDGQKVHWGGHASSALHVSINRPCIKKVSKRLKNLKLSTSPIAIQRLMYNQEQENAQQATNVQDTRRDSLTVNKQRNRKPKKT